MATETLNVVVDFETKKAEQAAGKLSGGLGSIVGGLAGGALVGGLAAAGSAALDFAQDSVKAASQVEQSTGAVQSVFGEMSGDVEANAKKAAGAVGLSIGQYQELAAVTGSLLKGKGVSDMGELAAATDALTVKGADLSAMFGGTTAEAVEAMGSALKGQFDPLEKYGISINAAKVEAKALEMGHVDAAGKATEYGKAMAAQALIMEQSADSAGTFAAESDTLAGKQAKAAASMENAKAVIGTALMPVMELLTDVIGKYLAPVLEDLGPLFKIVADVVGQILGPVLEVLGELISMIVSLLTGDFDAAWAHAEGVVKGFANVFRSIINLVIKAWNALDWQMDFTVPDWVPGLAGKGYT